jgi:calcium-independent phospholipase A2-gamma
MQKAAMRATTAAPTFFKPVLMGGDVYSDGGLIASNPTAVAIHEARQLYPNIPIEMIVSVGTGEFVNEKMSLKFGWDGVISQIVKSATDTSRTHWIVEDILGNGNTAQGADTVSKTKYYRFDPVVGTSVDFPIDGTDKNQLEKLKRITNAYMEEPEQKEKLRKIGKILRVQ